LLLNLFVFAVAMESDAGRRKIGPFRVFRPVVAAATAVPFFFDGMVWSGNGLLLETFGAVLGVPLGLVPMRAMTFEYDRAAGKPYSRAGWTYVLAWLAITAGKVFFSYGSTDLWSVALGRWMADEHIPVESFKAAVIFMNVATMLRVAALYVGARRVTSRSGS
jgi:hypothetical protein